MAIDLLDPVRRDVVRIELAAADALGPDEEVVRDRWRLRANGGVARRANSVLPAARASHAPPRSREEHGGRSQRLQQITAFYRQRGLVPRIQLSLAAPAGLDAALQRAGWAREDGAVVMLGATAPAPAIEGAGRASIVVAERPSGAWLAVQAAVTPGRVDWALRRAERLASARRPAWHGLVRDGDGRPVAAGLAVLDPPSALVGLFAFATTPDARRRGHAHRLLAELLARGRRAGAFRAYLQVHADNAAARSLYRSAGFREHHRYHYRRAPEGDA